MEKQQAMENSYIQLSCRLPYKKTDIILSVPNGFKVKELKENRKWGNTCAIYLSNGNNYIQLDDEYIFRQNMSILVQQSKKLKKRSPKSLSNIEFDFFFLLIKFF